VRVVDGQPIEDPRENGVALDRGLAIGKAQHVKPMCAQHSGSKRVSRHSFSLEVLPTVQLDDKACLETREVGKEPADGALATKLVAAELAITQTLPEGALGVGG